MTHRTRDVFIGLDRSPDVRYPKCSVPSCRSRTRSPVSAFCNSHLLALRTRGHVHQPLWWGQVRDDWRRLASKAIGRTFSNGRTDPVLLAAWNAWDSLLSECRSTTKTLPSAETKMRYRAAQEVLRLLERYRHPIKLPKRVAMELLRVVMMAKLTHHFLTSRTVEHAIGSIPMRLSHSMAGPGRVYDPATDTMRKHKQFTRTGLPRILLASHKLLMKHYADFLRVAVPEFEKVRAHTIANKAGHLFHPASRPHSSPPKKSRSAS